jgi:RNA polymerase sigma factor (sigma-70 family)
LERDEFDARYDELLRDLRRLCRAVGAGDESEDAAQEALLLGRARLHDLRDESKLVPWLRRIAVRRAARVRRTPAEALDSALAGARANLDLAIDERAAIAALPLRERQMVTLVYVAGYRELEAASMLGVSRGTVAKTLWRARCELARHLADYAEKG